MAETLSRARRCLLLLALAAAFWAATLVVAGRLGVHVAGVRLSKLNPWVPFALAVGVAALYALRFRAHWISDVAHLTRLRGGTIATAAVAATLAIGMTCGSFIAGGPDAFGYVTQAEMWAKGSVRTPGAQWARDAPWDDAELTSAPVGLRPALSGTDFVPSYSPGYPLLMALLHLLFGAPAVFAAVPVLGAVAVWTTYRIGAQLGGEWSGAVASVLLLASPAFLMMLVQPMSDIPASAWLALALAALFTPTTRHAFGSGVALGLCILTRPNLAPLAVPLAIAIWMDGPNREAVRRRLVAFAGGIAPAVLMIAFVNWSWYGAPWRSGYDPLSELFSWTRIPTNFMLYSRALLSTQTVLLLLAPVAPLLLRQMRRGDQRDATRMPATPSGAVLAAAALVPAAVFALYLPYERMKVWWFLRFLLPMYPGLMAALAAVLVTGARRLKSRSMAIAAVSAITAAVVSHGVLFSKREGAFRIKTADTRYLDSARYARFLPAGSVFLGRVHLGAIRRYAQRDVLRWEALPPDALDPAVRYLRNLGREVHFVGDVDELPLFRAHFAGAATLSDMAADAPVHHVKGGVVFYSLGKAVGR